MFFYETPANGKGMKQRQKQLAGEIGWAFDISICPAAKRAVVVGKGVEGCPPKPIQLAGAKRRHAMPDQAGTLPRIGRITPGDFSEIEIEISDLLC
jgi:hypothetical protein